MRNIETIKTYGKPKVRGVSTVTGTAAAASVRCLINRTMFTFISLFAEMIKLEWVCSTSNPTHCTANKIQTSQAQLIGKHMFPASVSLGSVESDGGSHCSDMIKSRSMLCSFTSANELDMLHVPTKQNTHKTSCSLGWHQYTENTTSVLEDMAMFACSLILIG